MKRTMIRYTVKPDRVAENEQYVREVYEQLKREQPEGLHYATFKLDDGVSFMHIVSVETADGTNPMLNFSAFQAFSTTVRDRYVEPPIFTELEEVGSYHLFGE